MKRGIGILMLAAMLAACGSGSSGSAKAAPTPTVTVTAAAPVPTIAAKGLEASSLELTCAQVRIVVKAIEGGDPASSITKYLADSAKGFAGVADPVAQQYAASLRAAESALPDAQLAAARAALKVCNASGVKPL